MIIYCSVLTTSHVVKQIGEQGPAREATTRDFVVACICGHAGQSRCAVGGKGWSASSLSASQPQATALGYSCREVEKQECNYAEAARTFGERALERGSPLGTCMQAIAEKKNQWEKQKHLRVLRSQQTFSFPFGPITPTLLSLGPRFLLLSVRNTHTQSPGMAKL